MHPVKADYSWSAFIAAIFFLVLVVRFPCDSIREGFDIAVRVVAGVVLAGVMWEKVGKCPAMFLMFAIASCFYPRFTDEYSYKALTEILFLCLIYTVMVMKVKNTRIILNVLCWVALTNVAFLAAQQELIDPYWIFGMENGSKLGELRTGLMSNPNDAGAFLALSMPAFFDGLQEWDKQVEYPPMRLIAIPMVMFGILIAHSDGPLAAVVIGFIVGSWVAGFEIFTAIVGTLIVSYAVIFVYINGDHGASVRVDIWKKTLGLLLLNWKSGIGVGNWEMVYPYLVKGKALPGGFIRLHNTYVEGVVEMGILFVPFIVGTVGNFLRNIGACKVVSVMIVVNIVMVNMGNSVFKMNGLNGLVIVVLLAVVQIRKTNNGPCQPIIQKGEPWASSPMVSPSF